VRADKLREVTDGHDGTWVAHPGLVPVAMEIFDEHMPGPNQLERTREDVVVTRADLLRVPEGTPHRSGPAPQRARGRAVPRGLAARQGCVPLYNLMEDAATAEISRAQVWQWLRHGPCSTTASPSRRAFCAPGWTRMHRPRAEVGEALRERPLPEARALFER
jgi:malate synthase